MRNLTDPSPRVAALSAFVVAASSSAGAVIHLTHEQSSESTVVGSVEHIALVLFSLMVLGLIAPMMYLGRHAAGSVKPGIVTAAAAIPLAILGQISNVRGEDPAFFGFIAAPTNLAIFGAMVAIAVMASKRGFQPRWLVIALPVVQIAALPLSQFGGMFIAAAYWLALAAWIHRSERATAPAAAVPAAA
ncbi:MAG: hypothetical protein U0R51_03640 [Solirubrobacterales bacterium]